MKLLVTGSSGYIGKRLIRAALIDGHEVVAASRSLKADVALWMPYELSSISPFEVPPDTNAVVHLAAITSSLVGDDVDMELRAARILLSATRNVGAKFIFVSSQAARFNAPTPYGVTKWRIEQEVLSAGGWVVRPGQVYGGVEGGLFGKLVNFVRYYYVVPSIVPAPKIQPIHVDDLAVGLLKIIVQDSITPSILFVGSIEPVSFTEFLKVIATKRVRRFRLRIPIPVVVISIINAMVAKRFRKHLGFDRLNSLIELPFMNTAYDLQRMGLSLRPLSSGMHPSGSDTRRLLIFEGKAFLCCILKEQPDSTLLRRYVRVMEELRDGRSLCLPTWVLKLPLAISLLDDRSFLSSKRGSEFRWRLDAATLLSEASIQGSRRFLNTGKGPSLLNSIGMLFRALIAEFCLRILRLVGASFFSRLLRDTEQYP